MFVDLISLVGLTRASERSFLFGRARPRQARTAAWVASSAESGTRGEAARFVEPTDRRCEAIQEMHQEIAQMHAAGTRPECLEQFL